VTGRWSSTGPALAQKADSKVCWIGILGLLPLLSVSSRFNDKTPNDYGVKSKDYLQRTLDGMATQSCTRHQGNLRTTLKKALFLNVKVNLQKG
jgi:hypothetical protein